jgi:ADP-heptose:LPS heptosyltransferase
MNDTQRLDSIRRVLVTRLRWLGDVVMSTPMLDALRQALPQARIEYLTYTTFAPVLQGHQACDQIHTLTPKAGPLETFAVARSLRRPEIDWCFDTLGNPRSGIMVRLMGPRHSVGPDRGFRSRPLYEYRQRHEPGERSAVRHQLDLLTPLLGRVEVRPTSLHVTDAERDAVAAQFRLDAGADLLLVHPGASRPDKVWPLECWPDLISQLQRLRPGLRVRVISQPGWEAAADEIVEGGSGDIASLPALGLRQLMAVLTHASLYVGNDGGILHTAVALRVPTVGIFGPTDKAVWFPYESWGPYRAVHGAGEGRRVKKSERGGTPGAGVGEVLDAIDQLRPFTPS